MTTTTPYQRDRPAVKHKLRAAWAIEDHGRALDGLQQLAVEHDHHHPGAAASLREGLEETVTLTRLRITGKLRTTLQLTNAIESMISLLRRTSRNVKRWHSGDMCLRWTAAGMLEAEQQVRKIIGYSDLAKLALAVEHDLTARGSLTTSPTTAEQAATLVTAYPSTTDLTAKFHSQRGIVGLRAADFKGSGD